jgi:hypothetical protein
MFDVFKAKLHGLIDKLLNEPQQEYAPSPDDIRMTTPPSSFPRVEFDVESKALQPLEESGLFDPLSTNWSSTLVSTDSVFKDGMFDDDATRYSSHGLPIVVGNTDINGDI